MRIVKRADFQAILNTKEKWAGKYVFVDFRRGVTTWPKLGITVTRRFGDAHKRNRFKRLVREAFRLCQQHLPSDLEMNVLPRHRQPPGKMDHVTSDFETFRSLLAQSEAKRGD